MQNVKIKSLPLGEAGGGEHDWEELNSLSYGSLQTFSASLVIRELLRLGVVNFIVSPGARSIPLILALNHYEDLQEQPLVNKPRLTLVNDERAAAFLAQGISKESIDSSNNIPCLICTSGTAVANYLPGIIEAYYSKVPVIIITADRPWELLNAGANQTINQKNIFKDFTCLTLDIPAPEKDINAHSLLSNIDQLYYSAREEGAPVHLNIAYRKPFYDNGYVPEINLSDEDRRIITAWYRQENPYFKITSRRKNVDISTNSASDISSLSKNTAIIVGPINDQELALKIAELSKLKNIPIIPDIHSNIRQLQTPNALCLFNLYLQDLDLKGQKPEIMYHIGERLISDVIHRFIDKHKIKLVSVRDDVTRIDAIENEYLYPSERISTNEFLLNLNLQKPCDPSYLERFLNVEKETRLKTNNVVSQESLTERQVITTAISSLPENTQIFLSASLIFREADHFVYSIPFGSRFFGNRGATGIDGIIASAIGTSINTSNPLFCLIGDQATLHDLTSLNLSHKISNPIVFLVINNGGGGIFNLMKKSELKETLINPHEINFKSFVEGFNLTYSSPKSIEELKMTIQNSYQGGLKSVIEIRTDAVDSVRKLYKL